MDDLGLSAPGITLDALLERLRRSGIEVDRAAVAEAVRDHYLPAPEREGKGPGGGVRRSWPASIVARAKYFFRLRARGAKGDQLRLLLFLKDGWGWQYVRHSCIDGFRKNKVWAESPVKRRFRKPTQGDVNLFIDDIKDDLDIKHVGLAQFIYGMGLFGKPLPGTPRDALAPLMPITNTPPELATESSAKALKVFADLNLGWNEMAEMVATADEITVDRARFLFYQEYGRLRRWCHSQREKPFRESKATTNLLTLGRPREELARMCASMPGRFTLAQLLGHVFSVSVVLATPKVFITMLLGSGLDILERLDKGEASGEPSQQNL